MSTLHCRPGFGRREFLKIGALGAGLALPHYLRCAAAGETRAASAQAAILVFLRGGPSHQDTFDLKPDAPAEYRGEFRPIKTNASGVEICEHLPRMAKLADKYAILRGVSHNLADHGIGTQYMATGNRPLALLKHPAMGAVVGKEFPERSDVPSYVAMDEDPVGPGYLGTRYGALATGELPRPNQPFGVRGVSLGADLSLEQLKRRQGLASDLDKGFPGLEKLDENVTALDGFARRAHEIITSDRTRHALEIEREDAKTVARFGSNSAGLSLLAACRLIEAGVRFVTVQVDGWDTHRQNFAELKTKLLPTFDQGFSALLETLEERGLLASTAVLATGEFGRTPKVNGEAGRDHWARAMCCVLAGGAVRGGQVLGASDEKAAEPAAKGFAPDDVAATFYHLLGIDHRKEYQTAAGRPITLVRDGNVIEGLL